MGTDLKATILSNWPIKVTALALSTVLWAAVSAEEPTTQFVPIRVTIQTPPNRTLVQEIPTVQALYEGRARELVRLFASPPFVTKTVPDTMTGSVYTIDISPQDVRLVSDAAVVLQDVVPRQFVIALDDAASRLVRISPRVSVEVDSGFVQMGPVVAIPSSITVTGPAAQVSRIGNVFTVALELTNLRESLRQTVAIDTSAFGIVGVSHTNVDISVTVERVGQRSLEVPVIIGGGMWEAAPSTVQVLVRGPASRIRALTPDSLSARTPTPTADGAWVTITVVGPAGITATASPDSVRAQRMLL